ncbi:hypothetical protein TNCV_4391061 [Trichonephila clavipes]|nr:hypothetical protein TNCV_4391061 [Trichonephila clavipes]
MAEYEQLLTEFINLPSTFTKSWYLFSVRRHISGYHSPQVPTPEEPSQHPDSESGIERYAERPPASYGRIFLFPGRVELWKSR